MKTPKNMGVSIRERLTQRARERRDAFGAVGRFRGRKANPMGGVPPTDRNRPHAGPSRGGSSAHRRICHACLDSHNTIPIVHSELGPWRTVDRNMIIALPPNLTLTGALRGLPAEGGAPARRRLLNLFNQLLQTPEARIRESDANRIAPLKPTFDATPPKDTLVGSVDVVALAMPTSA